MSSQQSEISGTISPRTQGRTLTESRNGTVAVPDGAPCHANRVDGAPAIKKDKDAWK